MMRFTILVFLAASVGFGLKKQHLWMRCVGCESLLVPQEVQELPYRWVLAGYQRVEGVVVGLQGVGCPGRASSRPLQGVPHLDWETWCQASCCSDRCSNLCFLKVSQERKLVLQEMGREGFKGRYNSSNRDESQRKSVSSLYFYMVI